jgi:hypothetical protein
VHYSIRRDRLVGVDADRRPYSSAAFDGGCVLPLDGCRRGGDLRWARSLDVALFMQYTRKLLGGRSCWRWARARRRACSSGSCKLRYAAPPRRCWVRASPNCTPDVFVAGRSPRVQCGSVFDAPDVAPRSLGDVGGGGELRKR